MFDLMRLNLILLRSYVNLRRTMKTCSMERMHNFRFQIYHLLGHHFDISKTNITRYQRKYLQVLLTCNTEISHDFSHAQASSKWNSSKWAFIINTDYRTQRRIIDRQKRRILTSNELCGAHYHNLWFLKFCEDFLQ